MVASQTPHPNSKLEMAESNTTKKIMLSSIIKAATVLYD
jgi:hypothetical protein